MQSLDSVYHVYSSTVGLKQEGVVICIQTHNRIATIDPEIMVITQPKIVDGNEESICHNLGQ